GLLDEVHRSHAAHLMRILHEPAARGVKANFAAISSHPAATRSFSFLARTIVIIHTVVVLTQHRQIRRRRMPVALAGVDVANLASVSRNTAVRPRTHEILGHR